MGRKFADISGQRFGVLVAVEFLERKNGVTWWRCRCDCGKEKILRLTHLHKGGLALCPHVSKKLGSHHPLYSTWAGIVSRCCNEMDYQYPEYGGRGIFVCDAWKMSFDQFVEDVGPRPTANHSIDRINNDDGYHCGNVRWATARQQARNRRNNTILTIDKKSMCIAEWAEVSGVPAKLISTRLANGWSSRDAVFTRIGAIRRYSELSQWMRQ